MTTAPTTTRIAPDTVPARAGTGNGSAPIAAGRSPAFSRAEVAFMIGVPLLWAILLLFHPLGDDYYATVKDNVTRWLTVHTGMMVFIPLMAGVMLLLLRGIDGVAATVSRIALLPFAVFYAAGEIIVGIGTGLLIDNVNQLPASERATGVDLVDPFVESQINVVFSTLGAIGWLIALIAAAVALFQHGSRSVPVVVLLVLSAPLIAQHPPPYGPAGLALFIAAVLLVLRGRAVAHEPLRAARPLA
jgi:hypothetical protein